MTLIKRLVTHIPNSLLGPWILPRLGALRSGGGCGRFAADSRGAVLVELAFAVPVAIIIIIGCYDAGRLVLLHQKIDRASSTMADLVAQPESFSPDDDLDTLYSAATRLLEPFDLASNGLIIISEIQGQPDESGLILWQRSGGGSYSASSDIGSEGGTATLPDSFDTVREGEVLIAAEVFYDYEPLFLNYVIEPQIIEHQSYRRPRQR